MPLHQIKHRYTGAALFECELTEEQASGQAVRHALEKATAAKSNLRNSDLSGSDLSGSNLSGSNLSGSNLSGSDLSGAKGLKDSPQQRENLIAVARYISDHGLQMDDVHANCGTVHCIAGTACAILANGALLERQIGWQEAARLLIGNVAAAHFFDSQEDGMAFINSVLKEEA